MRRLSLIGLLLLCLLAALPSLAAPVTVAGAVVGPDDQPLPGAEVWLITRFGAVPFGDPTMLSGKCDASGNFVFADANLDEATPPSPYVFWLRPTVVAYQAPHALGWQQVKPDGGKVTVRCGKTGPITGRVTTPDGKPIAATATLEYLRLPSIEPGFGYLMLGRTLADHLAVPTDADGRFHIDWAPAGAFGMPSIAAPGYGRVRLFSRESARDVPITLRPAGRLEVRFTCPEDPAAVAGLKTFYYGGLSGTECADMVTTDAQGQLVVPELQPQRYMVGASFPAMAKWQAEMQNEVQVKSGETARLEIPLRQAVTVKGRVVDTAGAPVAGATVAMEQMIPGLIDWPTTDAVGQYTFCALPGVRQIQVASLPEDYVSADLSQRVVVGEQAATVPDFVVKRAATLTGTVVDQAGQPVPGATVHGGGGGGPVSGTGDRTSDAQGGFAVKQLDPDREVTVWAEAKGLITAQEVRIPAADLGKPVKLTLVPAQPVRLRVTVVGQDGQPIKGAQVQAMWQRAMIGTQVPGGATDEAGTWTSDPQVPIGQYQLGVSANGCSSASTGSWEVVPGETHDFGTVTLVRAAGSIAGQVVDAANKPLAGVKVFNSGDGPKRTETATDPQGHFALTGLFPGRAFVFADAEGYVFTGACAAVGATDVVLRLTPRPEVKALGDPLPPPAGPTRAAELDAAKQLIQGALASANQEYYRQRLAALLARVDLPAAIKLSAEANGAYGDAIAKAMGRQLIDDDPEGALEWLEKIDDTDEYASYQVFAVVELAKTHPDLARRQFDKALPLLDNIEENSGRAVLLAQLGAAMLPIDRALAETTLRQAQDLASPLPRDENGSEIRAQVANALARLDIDAAVEMVQGLTGYENRPVHFEQRLAAKIADANPERAEQLLNIAQEWERRRETVDVVSLMAAKDPARAMRIARAMQETDESKPRALGALAVALRQTDPQSALTLFAEAVAAATKAQGPGGPPGNYQNNRYGAVLTELSLIGRQIGYPLADELSYRAAAMRTTGSEDGPAGGYVDWQGSSLLLAMLSMADPALGREAALAQEPRLPREGDEWTRGEAVRGVLQAVMLSAPAEGLAMVAAHKNDGSWAQQGPHYVMQIAKLLLADPAERQALLQREYGFGSSEDTIWDR